MSKLLLPRSGNASEGIPGVSGGLILSPGSQFTKMKYDLVGGLQHLSVIGNANMITDQDVLALKLLGDGQVLYQHNLHGDASMITKALSTSGLGLNLVIATSKHIEISPFFTHEATDTTSAKKADHNYYIAQQSKGFYVKCKFRIEDVNRVQRFAVGFRKIERVLNDSTNYDEAFAGVVMKGTTDVVKQIRILNGSAAENATGKTVTVDVAQTLEVQVSDAGVCSLLVNGTKLTSDDGSYVDMTFDAGEELIPFIRYENGASDAGVSLLEFEHGLLIGK